MKVKTIGAIVIVLAWAAGPSHAQIIPFTEDFQLKKSDLDAIDQVFRPMLEDPKSKPGTKADWANDQTGSKGRVEYVKAMKIQGLPCKKIQFLILLAKPEQGRRFVIDYCRVEDGTWKSYP